MPRIALVTNHPPPFRIPVFERIAATPGVELDLVFCCRREPNRLWDLPPLQFRHTFLRERFTVRGSNYIHNNPDVLSALGRLAPDVVVTTGFNPTHLYAFFYARAHGVPHVAMTDGTEDSERTLSPAHRIVRRFVYSQSDAFISASLGGRDLYRSYGVAMEHWFQSCLCVDNDLYRDARPAAPDAYDFLFSGRLVADKNPLFALQVAAGAARRLGRKTSILFVGSGDQEPQLQAAAGAAAELVDATFVGHARQELLPHLYRSARIFLFPSAGDVWGVVGNEACAAGLPLIVSPHAGIAGELVLDGVNGFVCALDADLWSARAALLLNQPELRRRFGISSETRVARYRFEYAAAGIVDACRHAVARSPGKRIRQQARETG